MKGKKKVFTLILLAAAVAFLLPTFAHAQGKEQEVRILFLHDVHSHLNTFTTIEDGETLQRGGMSRIMSVAKKVYEESPDTLFLDAGDFSMGTVVQSVFETDAAELRVLGLLGVEATTIGNHEFDYGPEGLANALLAAKNSKDKVPAMIISNIDREATKAQNMEGADKLLQAMEEYGAAEYMIFEKGNVKIAVFGIFGKDAQDCAPFSELIFKDTIAAAKETVAKIKAEETADLIICISHSGTSADASVSEDEILAKSVPEIDVIVSGHTHSKLEEPIVHGSTYIVSCDEYGKYLGDLSLSRNADGTWELEDYTLHTISTSVEQDEETQEKIDAYLSMIDVNYMSRYGYTRTQVLAENTVGFVPSSDLGTKHTELNLGNIMSDSYRYTVEHLPEWDGIPVDVAVVPAGLVRESYPIGNITVEDVYNSFSLGIGEDGYAGYPLLSVYLTGAELKMVAEIDASLSTFVSYIRLYTSGLCWTYNPNRLILSKSYDVHLTTMDGERVELEDDKLYRVVADLYSAKLIGSVTDMSYGLISLVPKYADGTPVEDYADCIVTTDGREVKAWEAIANYMESFEDTNGNGIPDVPEKYAQIEGRKNVEDSKNIRDLVKNPNRFFFLIVGVILIVVLLLLAIVIVIIRKYRKASEKKRMEKKEKLKNRV